ncbi:hypothetical protein [Parasediminibacterium sp. JCM 36343]|uniref:hypothetical protein n=1 Tax=Parasediminibacterium sp. JCM 36343 TaxID=3374279 RepID=UPI00397D625B
MSKKILFLSVLAICSFIQLQTATAQCSICTKTAQQLGEGPAHSLNSGILYLMFAPLAIMGYIGMKWWKKEKEIMKS